MIERVLVGIDFSEASRKALVQGAFWARKYDVPLEAMHILHIPTPVFPEAFPAALDIPGTKEIEEHALAHLQKWLDPYPFGTARVAWGNPAEELVKEASPDMLLVISQVGHSLIQHLFFGSTAARVVRHAPCDVLVVRREAALTV